MVKMSMQVAIFHVDSEEKWQYPDSHCVYCGRKLQE